MTLYVALLLLLLPKKRCRIPSGTRRKKTKKRTKNTTQRHPPPQTETNQIPLVHASTPHEETRTRFPRVPHPPSTHPSGTTVLKSREGNQKKKRERGQHSKQPPCLLGSEGRTALTFDPEKGGCLPMEWRGVPDRRAPKFGSGGDTGFPGSLLCSTDLSGPAGWMVWAGLAVRCVKTPRGVHRRWMDGA